MKINNYFLIINLLFIPYYYLPIVFYHNILVNISSTIYWYNYIDNVKINKKLLLIDRICIINAIYNTFILCINFNYMFTLIAIFICLFGIYLHYLSKITDNKNKSICYHIIFHCLYHICSYVLLYINLFS